MHDRLMALVQRWKAEADALELAAMLDASKNTGARMARAATLQEVVASLAPILYEAELQPTDVAHNPPERP